MSTREDRLPEDLEALLGDSPLAEPEDLTVACYTCPLWHASALFDRQYGPGWTEYVLMRGARPWFAGHHQPRAPLLGALDERDPATWRRYIELATGHGVDVFIWDWYWYDDEPALHEALEDGFLRAPNVSDVQFAVMWTNHPWLSLFPTVHGDGSRSFPHACDAPDRIETVRRSMTYVISRYLHLPNYWQIEGKPVIVVFDASRLERLFGVADVCSLLDEFRDTARALGHEGIHFHVDCVMPVAWASGSSKEAVGDIAAMGFDSYGLYNSTIVAGVRRPLEEELPRYGVLAADVVATIWPELDAISTLPFLPAVSPGWDAAPRHNQLPRTGHGNRSEWPGTLVVVDETPGAFEALVCAARAFLASSTGPKIMTVGCWNEWTEGQYILPDTRLGYGMLKALARGLGRETHELSYASPGGGDPWPGEAGPGPRLLPLEGDW